MHQEARPLEALGLRVQVPAFMAEIVGTLSPPGPPEPAHQPALGRVGPPHHRQLRDAGRQRRPPGAAPRREGRRAPRQRPRGAGVVHVGQGRDRDARGGPRRPGRRAADQAGGPDRVQGATARWSSSATWSCAFDEGTVVHAGDDVAVGRLRRGRSAAMPALRPAGRGPGRQRDRRPRWPAPPSSCSKACTCPSGSTRTRPAAGRPTGAASEARRMRRFDYSRWDGTQVGFEFDADDVLAELTDDLLYHGDLNAGPAAHAAAGVPRPQRRAGRRACASCSSSCAGGARTSSSATTSAASTTTSPSGCARSSTWSGPASTSCSRRPGSRATSGARRSPTRWPPSGACSSTSCRPTWPARCRRCRSTSGRRREAREQFEELMDQLRQELMQSYFNQMSGAMSDVSPEQLQRMKDMFNALNQMLEKREQGEDIDRAVRAVHGAVRRLVPRQPADPRRAARADGPADGGHAGHAQLDDARAAGPAPGPGRGRCSRTWTCAGRSTGSAPTCGRPSRRRAGTAGLQLQRPGSRSGFAEAAGLMNRLGDMDQLENLLRRPTSPGALAEVDLDQAPRAPRRRRGPVPRPAGRAGQAAGGGRA